MALTSEGIRSVRACEVPAGIWPDGQQVAAPRVALVQWQADDSLCGQFFQVYVNDQLAGVTVDSLQRRMLIPVPTPFDGPVSIAVFAVDPQESQSAFGGELATHCLQGRVRITLLRSQHLPVDSHINIYWDHGTGMIDYTASLNTSPIPVWPSRRHKAGFGLSGFGRSDFGYDASAAVGFGGGNFGSGGFGIDADTIEWISPALADGTYRFGLVVCDRRGNTSMACETDPVCVVRSARPVEKTAVDWEGSQDGSFMLCVED